MNPTARRADQILADAPLAANLMARLAAARAAARCIAPVCAEIAPDFDPLQPGCCDLRDHVLRIWLSSPAHTSKLRQATPRLLARLRDHGLEVSEIKVGVQLGTLREAPRDDGRKSADFTPKEGASSVAMVKRYSAALEFSRKLALTFPESGLGRAAARMAREVGAGLARMRESNQSFDEQNRKEKNAKAQGT
jgi:hypothetical protein